jgi:hypothetical protein
MLREIGRPERIPEYIARAKDKDDPFRLMGFGHRVYKNLRPAREGDAADRGGGADGAQHLRPVLDTPASSSRSRSGRIFHREEALSRTSISIRA